MPKVLADYQNEVVALVQDKASDLLPADRDKAIEHAVERFSQVRPREVVADVVGTGASDYTPPSGWVENWTKLRKIEYPIGDAPATYLEDSEFGIYKTTSAEKIRLNEIKPSASQSFRVTFTGLHSVTASAGTIGDGDFRALCHLAGAIACQMLANRYSQNIESTLSADVVDHKSKAFEYSQRSRDLYKVYRQHIGADPEVPAPAAAAFQDLDVNFPWGEDRLTHPRKWR